jgi:hypothetical protein
MKRCLFIGLVGGFLIAVPGCDFEGAEPGECSDGVDNDQDGAADCDDESCKTDVGCTGDDDEDGPCGDIEPGPGNLWGTVVRSGPFAGDAIGTLHVSVFDRDPMESDEACPVAKVKYYEVDLSEAESAFSYTLLGVPTRAEAYSVFAILDDNGDLEASVEPVLGAGDLITWKASWSTSPLGQTMAGHLPPVPTAIVEDAEPVEVFLNVNCLWEPTTTSGDPSDGRCRGL